MLCAVNNTCWNHFSSRYYISPSSSSAPHIASLHPSSSRHPARAHWRNLFTYINCSMEKLKRSVWYTMWRSIQTRITCELTAFCSDKSFCIFLKTPPFSENGLGGGGGRSGGAWDLERGGWGEWGRKEMEGYATTDYSSVQERQKRVQRKEKQDRKDFFFCLFVQFS